MRLSRLAAALPFAHRHTGDAVEIHGIVADSRRVRPGDLFVAVRGVRVDGHQFVAEAVARGAVAVVGEAPVDTLLGEQPSAGRFSYVQVPDSRGAWGWLCAAWHDFPSRKMTVVGVTGTDGKMTTGNLIDAILRASGATTGMISTVNARIGDVEIDTGLHVTTPDAPEVQAYLARMVAGGATHAVLEVTSHGLSQRRVSGCDFDVAVITNITHEHLDAHGSFAAYREAKASLFAGLDRSFRKPAVPKAAILNQDDSSFDFLSALPADQCVTYGVEQRADVTAHHIHYSGACTHFVLCTPAGEIDIETALVGSFNVSNILAAAAAGVALGIELGAIRAGVAGMRGIPGRLERIGEGQEFLAIVDFAHTPNALRQALGTARMMADRDGRVIVVFGSAGLRDREKRRMMGREAGKLADQVVITAEDPRTEDLDAVLTESCAGATAVGKVEGVDVWRVADRGEAILFACRMARAGDVVIACGKGHEQSMCFGTIEYPWDDREAMRRALRGGTLDTLPTAALT